MTAVEPQHMQTAEFGEAIKLLGYDLHEGDALDVRLYWESLGQAYREL